MTFEFFLTANFVWAYCAVIGVLWLYWTSKLSLKTFILHRKVREINDELSTIADEDEFFDRF